MAPPKPIQNPPHPLTNTDLGVCEAPESLPLESSTLVSTPTGFIEVGYDENSCYARPAELRREPTSVLHSSAAASLRDRHVAIRLGESLEQWIERRERSGELVDLDIQALADLLRQGRFPTAEEVNTNPIFNRSYNDAALDAVIHTVAVQVTGGHSIHAQALSLTLPYYFQQNPSSPADQAIRQGLIVALSSSSDSDTRQILATAQTTANPIVRAEIAQALNPSSQGGGQAAPAQGEAGRGAAPTAPSPASIPQASDSLRYAVANSLARAVLATNPVLGGGAAFLAEGSVEGARTVYNSDLLSPWRLSISSIVRGFVLPILDRGPAAPSHHPSSPSQEVSNEGGTNVAGDSPSPAVDPAASASIKSTNAIPAENHLGLIYGLTLLSADPHASKVEILYRTLTSWGLSDSTAQKIIDALPSPLLVGYAGLQYALSQAAGYAPTTHYSASFSTAAYRVEAAKPAAESHSETDAGTSDGGSSYAGTSHQGGGSGDHPQDAPHDEADVYLRS